jgi:hypothetical protein
MVVAIDRMRFISATSFILRAELVSPAALINATTLASGDEFPMNLGVVCRIIFDVFLIKCWKSPSEISFFRHSDEQGFR